MLSIEQIKQWSHGSWLALSGNTIIEDLVIDSRRISAPESSLFVALSSERRNGHDFIGNAYEKGIRNFLVHQHIDTDKYPSANFLLVKNTLQALQLITATYRKQFDIPVIGITGSNGKTVVKEWLYELLSDEYNLVRSPKSYNSQIGVPLSVWLLEPEHELAIFETGISQPGEMEQLEKIIHPTIGIFTNVGEAHSEWFMNQRQKINEKLVLFRNAKQLIYCKDYLDLNEWIVQYKTQLRETNALELFTWSHKYEADLKIVEVDKQENTTTIHALYKSEKIGINIPFTDHASMENTIHCWAALLLLGVDQKKIEEKMTKLHPVSMRLELRHGINDCTIINDTYNSDLTSLQIALDYLEQQKQHTQHTVILSDILQLGKSDAELYEEVAEMISRRNIQRFIGVGPALYKYKHLFREHTKLRCVFFKSTEDLLKKIHLINFDNEAILLKGARAFRFEKIDLLLEQKIHQTVLSINLTNLTHNLNVFRSQIKPNVKIMAMVKAFSYGSGSFEVANLLQFSGVDYLSVAYTDEGITLRKAGITMPIMVMSPDASSFDRMIAWKLEPEIFNLRSLYHFLKMAVTLRETNYPIHIKLDTGMHRLGFVKDEIEELIRILNESPQIRAASIFSHLAASEDPSMDYFTSEQSTHFDEMAAKLVEGIGYAPIKHLCNSSAVPRHRHLHYDMVRIGLGLYGIDGSGIIQTQLKQISTLKTTIAQIKNVKPGDTIGYGRKGFVNQDMQIATISIGYADGYPRALSNAETYVLIHDKPAKLVGVVCMDMCMVDITHIPDAKEGDEAIIFGEQLHVTQLAKWAGTISYEIMTGISQRVKRVYVNEE